MTERDDAPRVAIIGMGPRGLGAAEALCARGRFALDLFDPGDEPGAGPNFSTDQSPQCLLNLPVRAVEVSPGPRTPDRGVGSFADWLGPGADPERYPARAELGGYLLDRARALLAAEPGARHLKQKATALERDASGWWVVTAEVRHGPYAEVLLTEGQPPEEPDPQLARWQDHAAGHGLDLCTAYPDRALLDAAKGWAGKAVGVRGLGLSTLDVLRLLTVGLGGRFDGARYIASGREPARILPFSLDGHAPAPKPMNAGVDVRFDPTEEETAAFTAAVGEAMEMAPEAALARICAVVEAPAARLSGSATEAVRDWLAAERDTPGSQETRDAVEALEAHVAMARGTAPPDIGFAVGQLWRKWQTPLRKAYNRPPAPPETAKRLVKFDDGLKRFSYGPPLRSAEEMLVLIRAGVVDLRAVDDPDVELVPEGWELDAADATARVSAMVDAVLPSPKLEVVTDPLMAALRDAGLLRPLAGGLGAATGSDGGVLDAQGVSVPGLSMLGRMAYGSVIAVDSIHDCFGAAATRWAEGVSDRLVG